jgi:hypothetical protein
MTIEKKMQLQLEAVDPLANEPLEMGVEALIATIDDKKEMINAIRALRGSKITPLTRTAEFFEISDATRRRGNG